MFQPRSAKTAYILAFFILVTLIPLAFAGEKATVLPPPTLDPAVKGEQTIVLAGGCFWGMEAVFEHIKGVKDVVSGYSGGEAATAHYEQVSEGTTGHAESVKITYDPAQISIGQLLQVYMSVAHNPTELNYQGPDHGTQYRSEIFYTTPDQQKVAEAYILQLSGAKVFSAPIVTKIEPLSKFYPAEDYHQDFADRNPTHPYIMAYDRAKVDNLKQNFPDLYVAH